MGQRKKVREFIGTLKDKASLTKATLSPKRSTSSITVAVLRATTHSPTSSPPPHHRVAAVLHLGNSSRATASKCIQAIMDRLHRTRNAHVALKCLVTLHAIVTRGSFILRDQLSYYPAAGGHNFLNLSTFRDDADVDALELSTWVRWYAAVLEHNFITSRILGSQFSSSFSKIEKEKDLESVTTSFNSDLVRNIEALVGMVEEICKFPNSLNLQQNNLVYQLIRLVGEDYRSTQHQMTIRLSEFDDRIRGTSHSDSAELMSCLKRLEDCKERLVGLFVNRHRNDGFWDLISQTRMKLWKEKEERERGRLVLMWREEEEEEEEESEWTRFEERFEIPSSWVRLECGSEWSSMDRVHLTVTAIA